ncbi:hypothetical protein TNCV_5114741 [Trichonephila clavipes]|nr:hypothetical protein TNCV_5114741 [Trichonephila clavipes]
MTPELASHLQTSTPRQWDDFELDRFDVRKPIYTSSGYGHEFEASVSQVRVLMPLKNQLVDAADAYEIYRAQSHSIDVVW